MPAATLASSRFFLQHWRAESRVGFLRIHPHTPFVGYHSLSALESRARARALTITHQCEEIRVAVLQAGAVGLMRRMRHGFSIVRRTRISLTLSGGQLRRRYCPGHTRIRGTAEPHRAYSLGPVHLGGFSLLNGDRKMAAGGDGKQQAQPPGAPPKAHCRSSSCRRRLPSLLPLLLLLPPPPLPLTPLTLTPRRRRRRRRA